MTSFLLKARYDKKIYDMTVSILGDRLVLTFPYNVKLIADTKMLEGAEWDKDKKVWSCKNNRRNLFALDCMCDKTEIRKWYIPKLEINPSRTLWSHQVSIFREIVTYKRLIIAAEMRVGKTLPTFEAIEYITQIYPDMLIWWIAPKSAIHGLKREVEKWDFKINIEFMTYDHFRGIVDRDIYGPAPRFIVYDEAQKLKTPTSIQGKAARILSDDQKTTYGNEYYIVELSGTPAPKDPSDWWNLTETAQPGWLKEPSKEYLKKSISESELEEGTAAHSFWKFKFWKEDEIHRLYKRLAGLTYVYLKKDCLDLPEKTFEEVILPPSKKLLLAAKMIASNAQNGLEATNLLRQLSDGFQYEHEIDPETYKKTRTGYKYFGTPKENQLREDLRNHEDIGRLIVYGGFEATVDKITEICLAEDWTVLRIDGRGWQVFQSNTDSVPSAEHCEAEMDRSSDKGDIEKLVIVAQADSASTGLEFSASPTIIYYSNSNSGAARMQSEDRPHSNNMDKERGLLIKDYIHLPTDKKIRDNLREKKHLQSISMGELKEVFESPAVWELLRDA